MSGQGRFSIGGGQPLAFIAGPCVIESAEHALDTALAIREIARALRRAGDLQGVVRQGQPHVADARSAAPASTPGLAGARRRQGAHRLADPHRHPRARPRRAGRRGRRRPADSRLPLAADRPARRRGAHRQASSTSRRASSWRRATCATSSPRSPPKATTSVLVTERGVSFGYNNLVVDMRALSDAARARLPGRLRRHPQPAAARRRRRRDRRAGASTSSRWPPPASPPASTRCSWKSTRSRRAPRATPPTRCASTGSSR